MRNVYVKSKVTESKENYWCGSDEKLRDGT